MPDGKVLKVDIYYFMNCMYDEKLFCMDLLTHDIYIPMVKNLFSFLQSIFLGGYMDIMSLS